MPKYPNRTAMVEQARETRAGIARFATATEAVDETRDDVYLSPKSLTTYLGQAGFLQHADVTLTSAEVKALRATPQTLVAAQGAGSAIKFMGALLKLNYGGSNAFTESADNLAIKYTNGSGVAVSGTIESTNFIDATADTYTNGEPASDAIVAAASAENQALVLHNTGDGEIAGNAANDNTVSVRVYYVVQSI